MSTLTQIRRKVRLLTGRPSPQQITDSQIDEYVNTFYQQDMPEHLRLFSEETKFEFMTEANVDEYDMRTMQVWTGTSNEAAVDVFINLQPPAYVAGYQVMWNQDRSRFFRVYPPLAQIISTVVGDGTPGPYTTSLPNTPVLQSQVTVGAIDSTGAVLNLIDVPTNRTTGTWQQINTNTAETGSVSYLTGALSVTFSSAIPAGNTITFTAVPYVASRPQALLFFDNILTVRPVPDQSYLVSINAYKSPTALLNDTSSPILQQWWQYLAYGAAKKVFEDSQDPEGVVIIMPELKKQETLVLRRTLVQQTNQRTATIYTGMQQFPYGNGWNAFLGVLNGLFRIYSPKY